MKTEYRRRASALECRAAAEAQVFAGYAAVFNSETTIGDYFVESIAPGAFSRALQGNQDIVALFNHEADHVLGRRSVGTLRLSEDGKGLAVEIDPPDTTLGRDLAISIGRGDINSMSFGFRVTDERWTDPENGLPRRQILGVELIEVSIVTFPAYEETSIGMRSLEAARDLAESMKSRNSILARAIATSETLRRQITIAEISQRLSRNTAA